MVTLKVLECTFVCLFMSIYFTYKAGKKFDNLVKKVCWGHEICLLDFSLLSILPTKAISSSGKTEAPPPKKILNGENAKSGWAHLNIGHS